MQDIMDVIHITRKGRMMDTLEKFYLFRVTKLNNQINDKLTVKLNIIFETIVRHNNCNSYTQERQQLASVLQDPLSSSQEYKSIPKQHITGHSPLPLSATDNQHHLTLGRLTTYPGQDNRRLQNTRST
jgi:hypothetical protein